MIQCRIYLSKETLMRFLIFFLINVWLFAEVDATIRIEKDVDQRSSIAVVDESAIEPYLASKFFKILQDDLKITGNFAVDSTHYLGSSAPSGEGKDFIDRKSVV